MVLWILELLELVRNRKSGKKYRKYRTKTMILGKAPSFLWFYLVLWIGPTFPVSSFGLASQVPLANLLMLFYSTASSLMIVTQNLSPTQPPQLHKWRSVGPVLSALRFQRSICHNGDWQAEDLGTWVCAIWAVIFWPFYILQLKLSSCHGSSSSWKLYAVFTRHITCLDFCFSSIKAG